MRADWDSDRGLLKLFSRPDGSGQFKLVREVEFAKGDIPPYSLYGRMHGAPADSPQIAARSRVDGPNAKLVALDINTGQVVRTIAERPGFDMDGVGYDPITARVVALSYGSGDGGIEYFDERVEAVRQQLNRALKDSTATPFSYSSDRSVFLVSAVQPDFPLDYYVFDSIKKKLDYFSSSRPEMGGEDVIDRRPFDYVSSDGLTIEGYYTTPQSAQESNLPLIVLPHGGPAGRDTLRYDWWAAFYAANGYAVYQPNFRGSSGYGAAFQEAGYGEWGRKMQDDLTNGVDALIAAGRTDPDRICIVGASYGGYAALAGATLTPDRYKCAISVNGVSDLPELIGYAKSRIGDFGADYWEKRIGSRFRDADELAAVSPARIAERAGAPILLMHGTDDTVVPIFQSKQMAAALKKAGKPYEFVELDGEDHWLSTAETRIEMLRRSLAFIDKHMKR